MEILTMMIAAWIGLMAAGNLGFPPPTLAAPAPPEKCAGHRFRIQSHWMAAPCEPAPVTPSPEPAEGHAFPTQPVLSPAGLVALLANRRSSFLLDVTVDRHDGGRYVVGDPLRVQGISAEAGYLHLLQLESDGFARLLYPCPGAGHPVRAGESFEIGREQRLVAQGRVGLQRIRAIVTQQPLHMTGVSANPHTVGAADLAQILGRFAQDEVLFSVEPR